MNWLEDTINMGFPNLFHDMPSQQNMYKEIYTSLTRSVLCREFVEFQSTLRRIIESQECFIDTTFIVWCQRLADIDMRRDKDTFPDSDVKQFTRTCKNSYEEYINNLGEQDSFTLRLLGIL